MAGSRFRACLRAARRRAQSRELVVDLFENCVLVAAAKARDGGRFHAKDVRFHAKDVADIRHVAAKNISFRGLIEQSR